MEHEIWQVQFHGRDIFSSTIEADSKIKREDIKGKESDKKSNLEMLSEQESSA